ncbi:hypothetical protein Sp245p_07780 [Azospirillum baldaniorum]|uniref:Uncharacterized protein n=1 Tax=Azospirillum baldaniorum TaxID=1064539 RepID=A0A9P1JRN8_9PROT|nr:hypothetical protein [Azospirillum baldaniorum]AWJ89691.1 hypothetical protein Sp245p_07780 [Azospirillum baldaniorum]NUB06080.1 hypothetical protein [Azospirillum baldaniorum]TWA76786.1 hypothetical protein FBZ85_108201 [Azospirillum brasilense]CCC98500.1 conserved protein of unknown function [Azospirillum baldaniorum]
MAVVYVARSAALTKWASDVGQGKHIFKLGVAADNDEAKAAIDAGWAGESDWRLIHSQEVPDVEEEAVIERLMRKEKVIDPTYYPKLKGATGVFRITLTNVQNSLLVAKAMSADEPLTDVKVKPKDIGEYMVRNALPSSS